MAQKTSVEVWGVYDIEEFNGKEKCIGTFKAIKEFALKVFDNVNENKYQKSYIENGDEVVVFNYLEEYNFEVEHLCDVLIDEFN
jgi:hypothetical protein